MRTCLRFLKCDLATHDRALFQVSQNGIDAMTYLVDRMAADFRPYISTVLPPVVERLGDSKEMVREKAQLLLLKMMEREVMSPQALFDKLTPAFSHKNGKIREEVMNCLQITLTEHGAQSLSVSRLVPALVKLLSDPMSTVRDTAFNTLVEVYRHVGDRLRADLQKKHTVPPSKLPALMKRFDDMQAAGDLLPSAFVIDGESNYHIYLFIVVKIVITLTGYCVEFVRDMRVLCGVQLWLWDHFYVRFDLRKF
ncbi:CLIP-associating protein [Blattella germanica]|nr:CLIP-associating protein [Blattella germanica]